MNKKKSTKLLAILLAGLLAATSLAGCDGGSSSGSKTDTSKATSTSAGTSAEGGQTAAGDLPAPDPDKRYTISYYGYWCGDYVPGNPVEKLISDALNVDIEVRKIRNNDAEAVNLMFASGEMPDCGWFDNDPDFMYDQELVRNFPKNMVEAYAPTFVKHMDENPIMWAQTLNGEDETQMRFLEGVTRQFVDNYLYSDYYRYDWIESLGIDLGVNVEKLNDNLYAADDGISLDKFEEIMRAFVEKDPDGNGQNDTIGVNAANIKQPQFYSGFDFIYGVNEVDGKAEQFYATPGYKEYLKYFQKLYAEGLVDPDIITPKSNTSWEKADKGMAGYFITSTNALQSWAVGRPPLSLLEKKSDVKLLLTPGLKPNGGKVSMHENISPAYGNFYISADVQEDDKIAKILQFVEYCLYGETRVSHFFGEEGVDWKMDESGKFTKINELPSGEKGTWTFSQHGQDELISSYISSEPLYDAGLKYWSKSENGKWLDFVKKPFKDDVRRETDFYKISATDGPNILQVVDTYRVDCILGRKDVDATWDAYITELNNNRYGDMMAELDKVPLLEDIVKEYS